MIIEQKEIAAVERLLSQVEHYYSLPDDEATRSSNPQDPVFFADHPHLLMPLGFNDFRAVNYDIDDHDAIVQTLPTESHLAFDRESFYRDTASGAWYWYEGIDYKKRRPPNARFRLHFWGPAKSQHYFPVAGWLKSLRELAETPSPATHTLVLPRLWTPRSQLEQELKLASQMPALITNVASAGLKLASLNWRQLEELVAELLRDRGLKVSVTPRTSDGGRDVIARGELIPGEPLLLAVEVKQKRVVGIADVQRALRANEDFPALLVATAGRFSAGVVRESSRERNAFRLFLKDGLALGQWIRAYVAKRQRRNTA